MMSLTFGLFTQVSGSGPLGPLVLQNKSENNVDRIKGGYSCNRRSVIQQIVAH